jgi:hypothetical protein
MFGRQRSAQVDSSKRIGRVIVLAAIGAWLTTPPLIGVSAAPSPKKLALTGTVTAISQVYTKPPSRRNWAVTVRVEKVKAGEYSQPEFTFTIHSPARAGLAVGCRCTIEAIWTGQGYVVAETRRMKCEGARR